LGRSSKQNYLVQIRLSRTYKIQIKTRKDSKPYSSLP